MSKGRRGPKRQLSRDEIHAMAQEVALELGGVAYSADDHLPSPVRHAGPDEWRLPDELDGQRLHKSTESGATWARDEPESRSLLLELGLAPRDLTVYGAFPDEGLSGVIAYPAAYSDPRVAVEAFKRMLQAPETRWETIQLGELSVERGTTDEFGPEGMTYLWADRACVYQIVGPDEAAAGRLAQSITPFDRPEEPIT